MLALLGGGELLEDRGGLLAGAQPAGKPGRLMGPGPGVEPGLQVGTPSAGIEPPPRQGGTGSPRQPQNKGGSQAAEAAREHGGPEVAGHAGTLRPGMTRVEPAQGATMSTVNVERVTELEVHGGRVTASGGTALRVWGRVFTGPRAAAAEAVPVAWAASVDLAGYEAADGMEVVLRTEPATAGAWCWRPRMHEGGGVGIAAGAAAALLAPARLAGWAWRRWVRRDLGRWRLALVAEARVVPIPGELVGLRLGRCCVRPVRIGGGA